MREQKILIFCQFYEQYRKENFYMKELELNVKGMSCAGCENRIKNVVMGLKEVKSVEANHETGKVKIVLKKDIEEELENKIKESIEKLDFEVE